MPTPMDAGYIMVSERHAKFVEDHPNGMILTQLEYGSDKLVVVKCQVWKDRPAAYGEPPDGTGMASMPIPGPTRFTMNSEVENAETSALGRALAMIGYHPKERMASDDEIAMKDDSADAAAKRVVAAFEADDSRPATPAQLSKLMAWGKRIFKDAADPEKELRKFVADNTGKRKRADLTRSDISTLFDLFKVYESAGAGSEVTTLPGVSDES